MMRTMARRIGAMLGIVMIVGLVFFLIWRVYLHHRQAGDEDEEPGVIAAVTLTSKLLT
jgi:hypothetical protein